MPLPVDVKNRVGHQTLKSLHSSLTWNWGKGQPAACSLPSGIDLEGKEHSTTYGYRWLYGKDVRWLYGKECIQGQEEPESLIRQSHFQVYI